MGDPNLLQTVPGAVTIFGKKDGGGINEAVDAEGKLIAFEVPPVGANWKPTYIRRCPNFKFHVWEPVHAWEPCAQVIGCTGRNHKCHRICDMFDRKEIHAFWSVRERRFIEVSVVYCDGIAYQIAFELNGVKFHLLKRWPHEYWHLVDGPIHTPPFKLGFIRATTRTTVSPFHFSLVMSTILLAIISNPFLAASHLTSLPGSVLGVVTMWPLCLFDILFQVSKDSPKISTPRRSMRVLIFKAKQIVVQTVANQENAFQFVTPRPLRRSITRLRVIFILRTLSIPLFFGTAPALAYKFGTGLEADWPKLAILVTLCLSTVLHPVAAWYTYHLGERVKVKDFMSDYLGSNRAFEMKLAIAATVAGVAAIMSSPSTMVALAATWIATVSWNAARTARNALFPTTRELEKSLVELANNLNDVDSETNQTSNLPSVPDGPCKACCGPIRVVEKSQVLDPPDTEFSRSFSQAFDEAVKRELVKRREANAEYD